MTRSELVRRLVLNEISDDFENVDQIILPSVARYGAQLALTISRAEVVEELTALVRAGFAKAYILSGRTPFERPLDGMPNVDIPEEDFVTYFFITKAGLEAHQADDTWWPFDDEGDLRPEGFQLDISES